MSLASSSSSSLLLLVAPVVVILVTFVSPPTEAVCMNCRRNDTKTDVSATKVDAQQLRRTLQLMDDHFTNAMINRLNAVVSRIHEDLDNVTDVQITFPEKEPDIVKRFSPIPVSSTRVRRGKNFFFLRSFFLPQFLRCSSTIGTNNYCRVQCCEEDDTNAMSARKSFCCSPLLHETWQRRPKLSWRNSKYPKRFLKKYVKSV